MVHFTLECTGRLPLIGMEPEPGRASAQELAIETGLMLLQQHPTQSGVKMPFTIKPESKLASFNTMHTFNIDRRRALF